MATPYLEEMRLVTKNNEAINANISLKTKVDGVIVPLDLTDYEFQGQARKTKSPDGVIICTITITVIGDPTGGRINLFVADTVVEELDPTRGFYDVLYRVGGGPIDNLYVAPFAVEGGVTQWA